MDGGALLIAILVIIGCSLFLYYDSKKDVTKLENNKNNELFKDYSVIVGAAAAGGFLAFVLLGFFQIIFSANDTQEVTSIGIIILSATICGCTGWIVKTIKECNDSGK